MWHYNQKSVKIIKLYHCFALSFNVWKNGEKKYSCFYRYCFRHPLELSFWEHIKRDNIKHHYILTQRCWSKGKYVPHIQLWLSHWFTPAAACCYGSPPPRARVDSFLSVRLGKLSVFLVAHPFVYSSPV